jgi:hypothetical protein
LDGNVLAMSQSISIEWPFEDADTLAHTSVLKIDGRQLVSPLKAIQSPHRAVTDKQTAESLSFPGIDPKFSPLFIVGETLKMDTVANVGHDAEVTNSLTKRMKERVIDGRVNLVFPRIPSPKLGSGISQLGPLRASALVGIQLEAGASLVIPPMPYGITSRRQFAEILENTKVEIQTFKASKEIIGFIPTTDNLELVRDMAREYVRIGCTVFAIDFSGASNRPSQMRTLVRTIRESLHIRKKAKESDQKYYIHIFDAATSKKSSNEVAPITDILTHPYGVDSTSGVMWGGSNLTDPRKLRYYRADDYGAYRADALASIGTSCNCPTCKKFGVDELYSASFQTVMGRLRTHKRHTYLAECNRISERIANGDATKGYLAYLHTKSSAEAEIDKIVQDVKEIKAGL